MFILINLTCFFWGILDQPDQSTTNTNRGVFPGAVDEDPAPNQWAPIRGKGVADVQDVSSVMPFDGGAVAGIFGSWRKPAKWPEIIGYGNWVWKIAAWIYYFYIDVFSLYIYIDGTCLSMNVNFMIYILGNENRTYIEIYNPVGVPCDICINMWALYTPFLSIDHFAQGRCQSSRQQLESSNSLGIPCLETRQALSSVEVWFLGSCDWKIPCFLYYLS